MSSTSRSHLRLLLENCKSMRQLQQAQAHLTTVGLAADAFFLSRLLAFCSHPALGCLRHARLLFTHARGPTLCIRNTMIKALLLRQHYAESLEIYCRLLRDGLVPDNYTFPYVLKACATLRDSAAGRQVHGHIVKLGFCSDTFVGNTAALMYFACGNVASAREAFDEILQRDAVTWTVMISGYAELGDIEAARWLFEESPIKDRGVWGAMISGYVQNNCSKEGLLMFRLMQAEGLEPDEGTLVSALSACSQIGALDIGTWIHHYIHRIGVTVTVRLGTALVDMYSKCGNLILAKKLFDEMPTRDIVCWNVMIHGLAMHGDGEGALELFARVNKEGLEPDDATFIAVLTACSHSGLVEEGLKVFNSMSSLQRIEPRGEHFACTVDALCRAGRLREARDIIERMPQGSSSLREKAIAWRALLSACWNQGEAPMAEVAAGRLIELEDHSGAYVLLSNIYGASGQRSYARRMRSWMEERGVVKVPGCSSLQLGGRVLEFVAGEQMQPEMKDAHGVLVTISEHSLEIDR